MSLNFIGKTLRRKDKIKDFILKEYSEVLTGDYLFKLNNEK